MSGAVQGLVAVQHYIHLHAKLDTKRDAQVRVDVEFRSVLLWVGPEATHYVSQLRVAVIEVWEGEPHRSPEVTRLMSSTPLGGHPCGPQKHWFSG